MRTVAMTESDRSLISLALEIARARFIEDAESGLLPSLAKQFMKQASEAEHLAMVLAEAEEISITIID